MYGMSRRIGLALAFGLIAVVLCLSFTGAALAQDAGQAAAPAVASGADSSAAPRPTDGIPLLWWIAPIGAVIALVFARKFYKEVLASDPGDADMIEIAEFVREGAMAYLWRQYKVVTVVFIVLAAILAFMAYGLKVQNGVVWFAFLTGGFFSGLCGFLGMKTATMASNRTAAGARHSLNRGLVVAFRAGAVMGLVVVGFALIDISAWFIILYYFAPQMTLTVITVVMLTFGMGASTQALFARVGGGIYTKAADVGADLVGKVEAGIPEDDARNPATIADNVGDNVGDVAGMGADLYESYAGSILATAALGVAAAMALFGGEGDLVWNVAIKFLAAPMVLAGIGIILSIIGIYMVKTQENASMSQLMGALGRGVNGSSALIAIAGLVVTYFLFNGITTPEGYEVKWYGIWGAMVAGLTAGIIIGKATEYYTSYDYKPTQKISEQAITGPATLIIGGVAEGMFSTWASLATIVVAIMAAFTFAGGGEELMLGLYGVGFAAVGMLATLGITLATDAYGPIADNAGGNAEMTHQEPYVRERTDALDSLGNTTAATGKGFAIGSAALTALALLAAYIEEVRFGQMHEAAATLSEVTQADPDEAQYIGYGKWGARVSMNKGKDDFAAYMTLNSHELPKPVQRELNKGAGSVKVMMEPAGLKEDGYIRHVTLTTTIDGKTRESRLELVAASKASLAQFMVFYNVTLLNPKVMCGMFCGVLLAFVFCAMTMKAVGRSANLMMIECRRQFEKIRQALRNDGKDEEFVQNPDNWPRRVEVDGQKYPDYANCVHIATVGAQKEMVVPSLMAIVVPVVVGLLFGVPGVMGLLAGGLTSGFAVAIFMANAGGAWDNAKKLIETFGKITAKDMLEDKATQDKVPAGIRDDLMNRAKLAMNAGRPDEIVYGKGSEDHKAGVVGDTVGDPFKDTSGPSLNILIKLMSMVSVVFAGLIVKYAPIIGAMLGLGG